MTNDDELMESLRRIAGLADPVPAPVAESARTALSTRRPDEELAALLTDSAHVPELVRGAGDEVRLLYFESGPVSVELQVESAGSRISVEGLVAGAGGEIIVESAATRRSTVTDSEGWFSFPDLPHGVMRIHLRASDGRPVTTSWVRL